MIGCVNRIQVALAQDADVGAGVLDGPSAYQSIIVKGTGRRGRRPLQHIAGIFLLAASLLAMKSKISCQNRFTPRCAGR